MKGRMRGVAAHGDKLNFGDFGLKTLESAWITDRQIGCSYPVTRHIKRGGKIWIRMVSTINRLRENRRPVWGSGKGGPTAGLGFVRRTYFVRNQGSAKSGARSYESGSAEIAG